jgi:predicted helicase
MTSLTSILDMYRTMAHSEREKGTYFERLILDYLTAEPAYADLYEKVWMYSDWAREQGLDARDSGIDLVARSFDGEYHAIQCKLYAADYTLQKSDIDSFFTASGKKPFTRRIIVSTTNKWSVHAEAALNDQQPPVTKIDLRALEESIIDWSRYESGKAVVSKPKKTLRPHQVRAIEDVRQGFSIADRGKLLMACGTGKTFTSLKLAEQIVGKGGRVLFLVPSLNLLSQTLTEWTQESSIPLHSFAVCSDSDVGKKKIDDDIVPILIHELQYPATTDAKALAREVLARSDHEHLAVVYSTYHSIGVVSDAQLLYDLPSFDLIICDEAHRTTGATFGDDDESAFVRVHEDSYIQAKKRLYMTATPRIYADAAKVKAEQDSITLCSMDDESLYGKELHVITFSDAVRQDLLVDYKVIVLAVEEAHVSRRLQSLLASEDNQLKVDDAAKIVGCWKALAKQDLTEELMGDEHPMKRAVAFCQVIEPGTNRSKTHKVSSKNIASIFQGVVEAYQEAENVEPASRLRCEARHVDGSMNASEKQERLDWLKAEPVVQPYSDVIEPCETVLPLVATPSPVGNSTAPKSTCRILSNVRCLSEGVDVPALDAVLFLTPRNSQVDVVQSVGRVMRKAPGKKRGYVILPVVIPAGVEPHEALADNKTYAVVWQVLQALRSHDDRFDAMINKMDLDLNRSILSKMEIVAVSDKAPKKRERSYADKRGGLNGAGGRSGFTIGSAASGRPEAETQTELQFEIGEIERAIYAKVVQKCGNRHHWEDWANDIAKIARTHIDRITGVLENPDNETEREAFNAFANELRDDLNDSITDSEVIEMLAQHLITKPVFDSLFADYSFASHNPISRAMQKVLDTLQEHRLEKEADTLESFYASVQERAAGIENAAGKQKIVVELYDKFFRNAFPRMTERLGIVYTPVEVVDFILHSVNHLLSRHFGQTLGSEGVHILDPFTGTGTFITRLLQSGLISPADLPRKYLNEIHANEIVLLAYYIAAINIEAVYHDLMAKSSPSADYNPFPGILLTDTFQLYEKEDLVSALMVDNSERRKLQKSLDIRVIIGNPPYSGGQESANDNNANIEYPCLDARIEETYVSKSSTALSKSLYNSYIRAIRWASDRVGKSGIIGFVTSAGFIDKSTTDGLRKCLVEEFSYLYIFHLRGNQRSTQGETSRKEGGKIFGSGSREPIAISFFVKDPAAKEVGQIYFYDIGDYLSREDKLAKIVEFDSIEGIGAIGAWQAIIPDAHGDWFRQRDDSFNDYIALGDKKGNGLKLFENFSLGIATNRDAWCYNPSRRSVEKNIERMIECYTSEVRRFHIEQGEMDRQEQEELVNDFIDTDPTKISWTVNLKQDLLRNKPLHFSPDSLITSLYRPFSKNWLYYDRRLNERVLQMPRIFPDASAVNRVICVTGVGARSFSTLITDILPCLDNIEKGQCFPLYLYDEPSAEKAQSGLFDEVPTSRKRRDAITEAGLVHFQDAYPGETIEREDIFYYIYGLFHSPDYRTRYGDNLSKELPRIPCVQKAADFWAFCKAGHELAELHIGYDKVEPCARITVNFASDAPESNEKLYRVEKMRYGKTKGTLTYNTWITLSNIPLDAYDYVVNGKSALDWVVERQCVKTDKDSGIENDANRWATETIGDPRYPLDLFLRVATVSLETNRIVAGLPELEI